MEDLMLALVTFHFHNQYNIIKVQSPETASKKHSVSRTEIRTLRASDCLALIITCVTDLLTCNDIVSVTGMPRAAAASCGCCRPSLDCNKILMFI